MAREILVEAFESIAGIGREAWDGCALNPTYARHPFTLYDFLEAAEESGSASPRTGWAPRHLAVRDKDGGVAGVMPLYLKSHSRGEYVFDWAWADAYERAGGRYYPKLVSAAPFTPATGPRMILRPGEGDETRKALLAGALQLCDRFGASGLHVNFPDQDEWRFLGEQGLLLRQDQQYHWLNHGYGGFEDYLAALNSGRRKTIRRERREAQAAVEIHSLTGKDITEDHWDAFFRFYMDTGSRKWGAPYLNRRFYSLIGERMPERILLVLARRRGKWIAGALNLIGGDCLYGRYWGCTEDVPFLHFELCYYQAIEHAIRLGLPRVEAGAQGQHKIARGYLPTAVHSAHYIADPALRGPVARYLDQERAAVRQEMDWLTEEYSPYREGGGV
jgi:predicted N-acyltransferase